MFILQLQYPTASSIVQSLLYLIRAWQPHSPRKDARAGLYSSRLSAYTFVVIANLPKSKRSNKVVQIAKDRCTTKVLRHASLAFLKIIVVISILTV
jgi:hypothetical protein